MCFVASQLSLPSCAEVLCRYTAQRWGKLFTGTAGKRIQCFFLSASWIQAMWRNRSSFKELLPSVKGENNREACWGGDERGDGVERIEKPFPCYGYLVHLDTQKETPITVLWADTSQQGILLSKKRSLSIGGPGLWRTQIAFISHI